MINPSEQTIQVVLFLGLLTLPIKMMALWRAARSNQKWWFIALTIISTFGILDLAYLFYFAPPEHRKKSSKE